MEHYKFDCVDDGVSLDDFFKEENVMPELASMNKLTFNKAQLLEIIKKNRDEHRKIFEEAMDGYRNQVISRLEQSIAEIKRGNKIEEILRIPRPVDQTKDYDRAIKMLDMSKNEEITLNEEEFSNYVMDEWSWSQSFYTANAGYSQAAAAKLK